MSQVVLELLLLSVALVGGWQGQLLLRRGGRSHRAYAVMLLADGMAAIIAYALLREESSWIAEPIGVVAIGAFVFLVMVPPLLRDLARRLVEHDRLGLALRVLSLRELLQPGLAARQERDDVEMFAAVRAGRTAEILARLRDRRARAEHDPSVRGTIDERIVLLFLYARQWGEAIEHFERTLGQGMQLGSPQLLVELVRAYLEEGNLDKAAELLDVLERSPVSRQAMFLFLLMRARMVFLAFLGRVDEVELLLARSGPLGVLPQEVRAYWRGVARYHRGDREGARAALDEAVRVGRGGRYREVAIEKLAALEGEAPAAPALPAPSVQVEALAERVATALRVPAARADTNVPTLEGSVRRLAPVTTALIAANLAVAISLVLAFGWHRGLDDEGVLAFVGANIKAEVVHGAWWRLHASTYLHFGLLHLGLNMYMLLVLGKLVEQIFGGWRIFAIYSLAGVVGALASLVYGVGAMSLGASGAVFGVLGAAIAELALRRRAYPQGWRRLLLGNLLFVALANLAIGFFYQHMIDQWAHMGGFVAGGLAGMILSRRAAYGRSIPVRLLAGVLVVASVLSLAYSAWGVSRTVFRTTSREVFLANMVFDPSPPAVRFAVDGITVTAPPTWLRVGGEASMLSRDLGVNALRADVSPRKAATVEELADRVGREVAESLKNDDHVSRVEDVEPSQPAPSGWAVRELRVLADLGEQERTPFRYVTFVRLDPDAELALMFFVEERRIPALLAVAPQILGSARRGR